MDQVDFQGAWLYPASPSFDRPDDQETLFNNGSSNFDWEFARDGQAATLAFGPHPGSNLSLISPCTGYSVDDWSPAALSQVKQHSYSSTLTLNYHSSASSNAANQVSELLPLEPQSKSFDDVFNHAAVLGAEPSLPPNLPLNFTSTKCSQLHSNPGLSDLIVRDGALATPSRLRQLPVTTRFRRCTRCWALRKKVYTFDLMTNLDRLTLLKCKRETFGMEDSRCLECIRFDIPAYICSWERVTQHKPFEKCASYYVHFQDKTNNSTGKNETYEILFTGVTQTGLHDRTIVQLQHYPDGPILTVECCQFTPTQKHQFHALKKNSSGWHSTKTTAYCLVNTRIDVSSYVKESVKFALDEACQSQHPVHLFFKLAQFYREVSILPAS